MNFCGWSGDRVLTILMSDWLRRRAPWGSDICHPLWSRVWHPWEHRAAIGQPFFDFTRKNFARWGRRWPYVFFPPMWVPFLQAGSWLHVQSWRLLGTSPSIFNGCPEMAGPGRLRGHRSSGRRRRPAEQWSSSGLLFPFLPSSARKEAQRSGQAQSAMSFFFFQYF